MKRIPHAQFEEFEFDSSGGVTSGYIKAENAKIKDGILTIDNVRMRESTPWKTIRIYLKGYERQLNKPVSPEKRINIPEITD